MARAHFYKVLLNTNGTPLTGASVSVRNTSDIAISDTLFLLESGSGFLTNPFTSATGVIEFYLTTAQRVHLHYTPPGGSETIVVVDVNPSADLIPASTFDPTALTASVAANTASIATHTGQIATLTTNEGTDASNISSLSTTVGGHTTSIAANASAITATNGNVTSLSTTVAGHTTAIGTLAGMSAATPAQTAATGTVGTSNAAARGDHRHQSQFQIEGTTLPLRDGGLGTTLVAVKAALGAVGTASDSGHRHPRYYRAPSDVGMLGWVDPPMLLNGQGSPLSNGVMSLIQVPMPEGGTIGHVFFCLQAAEITPTSGQSFCGVVNSSGTVIGNSTDQGSTGFASTGMRSIAVTVVGGQSLTVAAGDYVYVYVYTNAGTGPVFFRLAGTNQWQQLMSAPNYVYCQNATTGFTTTPPSTVALGSTTSSTGFWAGVGV